MAGPPLGKDAPDFTLPGLVLGADGTVVRSDYSLSALRVPGLADRLRGWRVDHVVEGSFRLPGARPVTALQIDCIQSLWFDSGAEMDAAFACLGDAVRAGEVHDDIFSAANSWSFQAEERVFFDQGRSLV